MLEKLKLGRRYDGFLFLAESARNPPMLQAHRHVELELNLVARGHITYILGDRRYTLGARDLLWFFPAQEHRLVDRTPDAQYYVAVFKPALIAASCRGLRYADLKLKRGVGDGLLHATLSPPVFELIRASMETVMEGSLDPDLLNREAGFGVGSSFRFSHGDPDALNAGLRHLLLQCWRSQLTGKMGSAVRLHPAVQKALHLLAEEGTATEGDLTALAGRCGVSSSYLSRTFRREVGVTLRRYRNSVRLARFWKVLRGPARRPLVVAALEAGFGSYAQFHRIYSEAYGMSPKAALKP